MGITQEISRIVAKRKKENKIREIENMTDINMEVWTTRQKKESLFKKVWRRFFK